MSNIVARIIKTLSLCIGMLILLGVAFYWVPLPVDFLSRQLALRADYFFEDEEEWLKKHSLWDIGAAKALEFKLRSDITSQIAERLQLKEIPEEEAIELAASETRFLYITQVQRRLPVISNSATVSLIRGYGFCDQINAGLALVLKDKLEQVHLYGVINPPDEGKHTLIKARTSLGTLWIDAFSCVNVFGFEDELTSRGKETIPLYESKAPYLFEEVAYREGFFFNAFSWQYSCKKAFNRIESLMKYKTYHPEQVLVMEKPDSLLAIDPEMQRAMMKDTQQESKEAKEAYLKARIYHLYGQNEEALAFYEKAQRKSVNGHIGGFAAIFIKRLKGEEVLCQTSKP